MSYSPSNPVEAKALALLGKNFPQEAVAKALGVTPGRISQLMADEGFAAEVANLRYQNLQAHSERDERIDRIEDKLLDKLEKAIPLLSAQEPAKIAKIWKDVNAAKRRGAAAENNNTLVSQTIINLTLPTQIINKYRSNDQSQVIEIDGKPFITAQPQMLEHELKEKENETRRLGTDDPGEVGEVDRPTTQRNFAPARKGQAISAEDL